MSESKQNTEHVQYQYGQHHRLDCIGDTLRQMKYSENTMYQRPNQVSLPEPFNGFWRQQMIEWMYTLVKFCELRICSASAAAYYLDTVVSRGIISTPTEYQLAAMTALNLGLKMYDSPTVRVLKLSSLVQLGSGDFNEQDVIQMEIKMIQTLDWCLHPPTANCFLEQYLLLLPLDTKVETKEKLEELAIQVIKTAVTRDFFSSTMNPSLIAYASILVAFNYMDQTDMSLVQLQTFLRNMIDIAGLDSNSHLLTRLTMLLDSSTTTTATMTTATRHRGLVSSNRHDDNENENEDDVTPTAAASSSSSSSSSSKVTGSATTSSPNNVVTMEQEQGGQQQQESHHQQ